MLGSIEEFKSWTLLMIDINLCLITMIENLYQHTLRYINSFREIDIY